MWCEKVTNNDFGNQDRPGRYLNLPPIAEDGLYAWMLEISGRYKYIGSELQESNIVAFFSKHNRLHSKSNQTFEKKARARIGSMTGR